LWFCPEFWWWDINIYLFFSAFTSRPTSFLASEFLCFYGISIIFQYIFIISVDQSLMCPI
jgi:hypothetical protein